MVCIPTLGLRWKGSRLVTEDSLFALSCQFELFAFGDRQISLFSEEGNSFEGKHILLAGSFGSLRAFNGWTFSEHRWCFWKEQLRFRGTAVTSKADRSSKQLDVLESARFAFSAPGEGWMGFSVLDMPAFVWHST